MVFLIHTELRCTVSHTSDLHKKQFLMGFKNNIRRMAAAVGNIACRLPRKFITLRFTSGEMESISCWILSFKSSRDRGLSLKTFSFRYPQKKKSHGHFDRARSVYRTLSASLSQNGCFHNTLQQQSPNVHQSNPLWVLKTVEANQLHDTTPTSLPLLQPAQCPLEMWEIFMLYSV